jgi:hypothetical protein
MTHLSWHNKWRRLSSLRFWLVLMAFRRLESMRHSFRKTLHVREKRQKNP